MASDPISLATLDASIGRHRWSICALIFAATTINYLDRNVLGLLKPLLSEAGVFGPDQAIQELNYSTVVICFQVAYAVGMLFAGRFIDRVGTRRGYAWSLTAWSFAAIGHAFGQHTWSFGFWRAALGLSEAGNFPAANKAVAEWFPKKERAFATGLYNSGANVGAIVAPLTVPFIAAAWGWEWAFILTGLVGFGWLFLWLPMYSAPADKLQAGKLTQAEYDYIHSDLDEQAAARAAGPEARVSWFRLLTFRQTWAFVAGKFMTDPIWWFFLFWLPAFLAGENARKAEAFVAANPGYAGSAADIPGVISWPIAVAVVYTVATVGSIFGGWLPKRFINSGMDANRARKLAMFIFALLPLSVLLASRLGAINTWLAVATISIACAAHQAWSANIFTTVSDMFPKRAVASVTGIGGMAGAVGGILIARAAGLLLQHYTELGKVEIGYAVLFVICGTAYLAAWLVMHLLVPKYQQVVLR
jgi:ACS family hexuronate transporter-like MFS transporter